MTPINNETKLLLDNENKTVEQKKTLKKKWKVIKIVSYTIKLVNQFNSTSIEDIKAFARQESCW